MGARLAGIITGILGITECTTNFERTFFTISGLVGSIVLVLASMTWGAWKNISIVREE